MATLQEIQADRHKWEKVPGTGTGPYNPARHRLKEKYKKEQREKLKKATMRERLTAATSSRKVSGKPTKSYGASKTPRAEPAKPSGIAVPNPPKVKIKILAPPKGYKRSPEIPSREEDIPAFKASKRKREEVDDDIDVISAQTPTASKAGGSLKKKKKKKYSAGGRVSYQGHDGNKLVSKYYS